MADWRYYRIRRALLTALQPIGITEPDLDLIKQVEQVTTFVLEGPARRFARIRSIEITGAAAILVFLIWQLLAWLIFRCKKQPKQPGAAEGDLFAKGQSGNATGLTRRFHEPGHIGCRSVALPNSVRLIHNLGNLACGSDFKVSHYSTRSEDVRITSKQRCWPKSAIFAFTSNQPTPGLETRAGLRHDYGRSGRCVSLRSAGMKYAGI